MEVNTDFPLASLKKKEKGGHLAKAKFSPCPEKFLNRWHRLSSLCQSSRLVLHSLERLCHQPIPDFSSFTGGLIGP